MTVLAGKSVAISISDAPDRLRLGFPEREIERIVYSICMAVVRAGGRIFYSGDLRPTGYTFKIFRHLAGAYAAQGVTPFTHVVPQPALMRSKFDEWDLSLKEARNTAKTLLVIGDDVVAFRRAADGLLVGSAGEVPSLLIKDEAAFVAWQSSLPRVDDAVAFTIARKAVTVMTEARIAMGGKMGLLNNPNDHYQGAAPGIIEEVTLNLEAKKPCVLLGAFGGATRDAAIALGLLPAGHSVERGTQMPSYHDAVAKLGGLRNALPPSLRDQLATLADDDGSETLAAAVVAVIADWAQNASPPRSD
ncbi:hypothetical protein [Rhizobium beringeri]|uniref:hypothetical protein n=1 Tax=Rhizobium beringeri TaxID=3019934 RepID=UPI002E135A3D|nr:hypothetical protein U8Q06_34755 [Rhizobium beringeri]